MPNYNQRPRRPPRSRRPALWLAAFLPVLLLCCAETVPSEYEVKAAFIYHFAKFVDWPSGTFPTAESPIILAVVGDDNMSKDIDAINGRVVGTHSVRVEWYRPEQLLRQTPPCQILYILPTEKSEAGPIVEQLHGRSILTICDGVRDFARVGADINLIRTSEGKIRFEINVDAAKRAGLKIQSPLLNLARIVREQ